MKKISYSFLLSLVVVFVTHRIQTMDVSSSVFSLGENIASTLAYDEVMKMFARRSKTFEDYKESTSSRINISRIKAFFSNQIQGVGLDPNNFRYYVGSAWMIFPLKNGTYGFIIPSADFSLSGSAHRLDIVNLDSLLKSSDPSSSSLYDEYRLQIIKALIEAKFEGVLSEASSNKLGSIKSYTTDIALDNAISIALSTLAGYMTSFSAWLGRAVTGSSYLYGQAASTQKTGFLQMEIDQYVIKSNDIELIQARIKDLKGQLKAENQSFITSKLSFINPYMPSSLQWGELGYTAKVLNLLEKYLEDNRLELKLYQQIMDKQRAR